MTTQKQTSGEYFKALTIVHFALLAGQVLFALVALLLNTQNLMTTTEDSLKNILIPIVLIFIINGVITGQIMYKKRLDKLKKEDSLFQKMSGYRSVIIVRLAFLESASFVPIIAYLLTADFVFLGSAGIAIIYFFMLKPSRNKAAMDLELSPADKIKIVDDTAIIAEVKSQN